MTDGRRGGRLAVGWLVAFAAASSGCKWLPVRHPERDRKPAVVAPTGGRDEADLPPLPEMHSIGDEEAFKPSAPTPLLNAAAARDAAIKRAISLSAAPETTPPRISPTLEIAPPPAPAAAARDDDAPRKTDRLVEPAAFRPPAEDLSERAVLHDPPPDGLDPGSQEGSLWEYVLSAMAVAVEAPAESPAAPPASAEPPQPVQPEFRISDLRVCRRVLGFGRTEALATETVLAGQTVLLYCELEGVRDEDVADGVRSRLASSVAILPSIEGEALWSFELGTAEDHCRRRRRDFFVNYRVKIPESLAPGTYRVRLMQSDLVAGCTASRSVPITVRSK